MRRIILIVVLVMVFSLAGMRLSVFASEESLRDIKGVYVLVPNIEPEVVQAGLTSDQIHIDVELKLRLAGIEVLNEELEKATEPIALTKPIIWIRVKTIKQKQEGWFIYYVSCELQQEVSLIRNPSIKDTVGTYDDYTFGAGGVKDIRERIKDLVDRFLNTYLSVNPKK